jgi:ankyrin repeat protein
MAGNDEVVKAIQAGDEEVLRKLLSEDPGLASARDAAGISALMHAIYRRQTTVIKLLRDAGMKVDWFEAAALGDTELLVGLLKENPTLINSYARDGFTALHLAAYFSQAGAARMLLENAANAAAVAQKRYASHAPAQRRFSCEPGNRSRPSETRRSGECAAAAWLDGSPCRRPEWQCGNCRSASSERG